jgi:hypothetical protein
MLRGREREGATIQNFAKEKIPSAYRIGRRYYTDINNATLFVPSGLTQQERNKTHISDLTERFDSG